ncbi:hypothetical protein KKC13_00820 [bacterium]|nr:hypothetical protein [bacterium]MBU1958937.1 hypothetical protein [bacterium]
MTKIMNSTVTSIADMLMPMVAPVRNDQGIDTIELVAKYKTFKSMVIAMGLKIKPVPKNNPIHEKIADEVKEDTTKRLKTEDFKPIVERIDLPKVQGKGHDKPMYISIIRNTPYLFGVATHHKKAKDSFCKVIFAGLHQPTKNISSDSMKIISRFLKRKAFKLHRFDIATDTTDHRTLGYQSKGAFKDDLMPYSKYGVIPKGSTLYINSLNHPRINTVLYYDKYQKQRNQQKKEKIGEELRGWKRLEVVITFDVTKRENKGFTDYIEGLNFVDDLYEFADIARLIGIKSYDRDYLEYQINSLLDNRTMNNHESKRQFNSVESLERFRQSDFRRYVLAI